MQTLPRNRRPDTSLPSQRTPKRVDIRGKLRASLEAMVWEGLAYDAAARKAGLTVRAMRMALERPHVLAWLRAERVVLRASLASNNVHRLAEIRDAANNMPAVQAIRALEGMDEAEQTTSRSLVNTAPGVVIRIIDGREQSNNVVDVTPAEANDYDLFD